MNQASNRIRLTVFRVIALLGLGVSALLLTEYLSDAPSLCTGASGCETVRGSEFASILFIPTPVWGLAFFAGILGVSLLGDARSRTWTFYLGALGALAAVGFILVQAFWVKAFCTYCLIVDVSALVLFGLAWPWRSPAPQSADQAEELASSGSLSSSTGSPGVIVGYGVATAVVVAVGLFIPRLAASDLDAVSIAVPSFVGEAQEPGKVTIVEFMHFGCKHCRAMHANYTKVLPEFGDKVEVLYRHYPLGSHNAARASVCATDRGKGEEMNDALFQATDLSPTATEQIAQDLGIELGWFRDCVNSEETAAAVDKDVADAKSVGINGVPVYWIGSRRLGGEISAHALRGHITTALREAAR